MIQFLRSDAPWASPCSTAKGHSFRARNALGRQLTFRELLKGLLPRCYLSISVQSTMWSFSSDVTGHNHILSKFTKLRGICKNYTYPLLYGLEMIFEDSESQNVRKH